MRTPRHDPLPLTAAVVLAAASAALLSIHPVEHKAVEASPQTDAVRDVPAHAPVVSDRLLVKLRQDAAKPAVDELLGRAKVSREAVIPELGVHVLRVSRDRGDAALALLEPSPLVEYAERDVRMRGFDTAPNDAEWPAQWGPRQIGAPRAWDAVRGSESVVIAVLDTGVDVSHPDLAGAFVPGYDLVRDDSQPDDEHGHGTATAGIVAARTNNGEGIAGACWTCRLMAVKVLGPDGHGDSATVARGIVWAADNGADVVNLSLGGPETTRTLTEAVAYAVGKGALLVAAAGNDGSATPAYPAASPGVLGVAALDELDERYDWSNYGPWVRVAAPGCNLAPLAGGGYGEYCGTSAAAPLVAGLAALARSFAPGATASQIEAAVEQASEPGQELRHGRIDAARTLSLLGAPSAASASFRLRGRVTRRAPAWGRSFSVEAGTVVATLTSSSSSRLGLSLVAAGGTAIRRVSGRAPLVATATVPDGEYRVLVSRRGRRDASFALRIRTFPGAAARGTS